ncbi:putative methyltransferase [Rosa chinensis]|uniref:Putative methyltransferase n=2 Tax=Rosa chinensis TaxID=74649 RepID=A0A2P6PWC5_ROSCH|nr:putative methyltransferase [Rosa chinensis]
MHAEFTSQKSVEVENKNRNKVKGALEAYREILTKSEAQNCNWSYIKAAMDLKKQGKWVNKMKQVGSIAGVKVGDRFRHRAQLTIVGLHQQFTCGIDYMWRNDGKILATSIVDSGRYVNNLQSSDILIYSGQGGKSLFHKTKPTYQTKPTDQIMQGGNLALRNSKEEGTPIRVIRRLKHSKGSCYVYYGLYTVERVLQERQLGIMIYKFMLRRKSGQPELSFDSS